SEGVEYFFAITAYDTACNESDSSVEVSYKIPVTNIIPPEIYSVNIRNEKLGDVIFSEKITKASAEDIHNYEINNRLKVLVAILDK
ncbi:MAG: hypothetical protein JSW07_00650, partial [bacterium]